MSKSIVKAIAALCFIVLLVPGSALAQNQNAEQVNVGGLISALNNISVEIDELEALNDLSVEDVQVVNVEDVLNDANVEALNNALNRNEVEIVDLRNVLNGNDIIKNALNNNNVAVGDVVAIDVLSGGDVVVFIQPQAEVDG